MPPQLAVGSEIRLQRGRDGQIRTTTGAGGYDFWRRYLTAFDHVTVVARVEQARDDDGSPVTGDGVDVFPLSNYVGLSGWARTLRSNHDKIRALCSRPDTAYIARVPGAVGSMMVSALRRQDRDCALEVVGDPESVFRSGVVPGPAAHLLGSLAAQQMRRQCAQAGAVSYVTAADLQRRYPATSARCSSSYSSIDLPEEAFRERLSHDIVGPADIIAVGSLSQRYKGHDVLIRALSVLRSQGRSCRVRIVGSGRLQEELRGLAASEGVAQYVTFVGQLEPGAQVWAELDRADLFVMPSRTEGLPRALIEAMARGLPSIGSRVGGIPELLPEEDMVPPDDAVALAERIGSFLADDRQRQVTSVRNIRVARGYAREIMAKRRAEFYSAVQSINA